MAKARVGAGLVASCVLVWTGATSALAAPTVAQMLTFRPKQPGIVYSTPTPQEQERCKVELVKGSRPGSDGWLLRDPDGKPLRRFFDSNGDRKIDIWSYYLNGVEVYREIDTNFNDKPDQYRWLNAGGMKWGIDINEDGKIDAWKTISPEEVSQEILQAVITRDYGRLQALMITEAEIKAMELPATEAGRVREALKAAPAKFQEAAGKVPGDAKAARWLHLETVSPQCLPADLSGMKLDLVKQPRGAILYEVNNKAEWLQTGEMIQVGTAWKIIGAPVVGQPTEIDSSSADGSMGKPVEPGMQPLLEDLHKKDLNPPRQDTPGPNAAVVKYNLERADILEKILAKDKPEARDGWMRQLADCFDAAAQCSSANDKMAYERLTRLLDQVKTQPGSSLAAYVTFREIRADYAMKQAQPNPQFEKIQGDWMTRLAKFVQDYPRAEDAPEALMQLGMMSELVGNKEVEAKNWYEQLIKNFPEHSLAMKAKGAIKRLDSVGKPLDLAGPRLGSTDMFNITQMKNKVVIVYYWASWNQQCSGDFTKLKQLLNSYGSKGLEMVSINLDTTAAEANTYLQITPVPGAHLFQEGGLDSPFAKDYGIMALPNLFLVGKDGKVVSRTVQVTNLEDEIKKLLDVK